MKARKEKSKNLGRPPFQITDKVLYEVETYAGRGLNKQQIADAIGIHIDTLIEKCKSFPEFSDAINRGKSLGISRVAERLLENVDNGNVQAQIFYLKVQGQWKETTVNEQHLIPHEDWLEKLK